MEIQFIGQGHKVSDDSCLASNLISLLKDNKYNSFKCLVAFASSIAFKSLLPHIDTAKNHLSEIVFIIGVDQFGTSNEALDQLLEMNVNSYIYYTSSTIIFHPKIYLFEGTEDVAIIVGSNNLTQKGLVQNIEGSVLIKYTKNEKVDFLKQIEEYYFTIFAGNDPNLYKLTTKLIDELVKDGIVKKEIEVRKIYNIKKPELSSKKDKSYPPRALQKIPKDFHPSISSEATTSLIPTADALPQSNSPITLEAKEVLIAQIGGPGRWQQVNFPIALFQEYFGATAGDNSYTVQIRHIEDNGTLNEVENRQTVTVLSKNYRIELGATAGKKYPPLPDRPIVVFIKRAGNEFLYKLFMPSDNDYSNISSYLSESYDGPERQLQRILISSDELKDNCPELYEIIENYI